MDKLNGWHLVALAFIACTTLVLLVWMGQEMGAIASLGLLILSALGFTAAQSYKNNAVSSEQLGQVKELANGNLEALRVELARKDAQMAMERTFYQTQLAQAHEKQVALATMLPPESKVPELEP